MSSVSCNGRAGLLVRSKTGFDTTTFLGSDITFETGIELVRGVLMTLLSGDPASLDPPLKGVTKVFFVLFLAGVRPTFIRRVDVGVLICIAVGCLTTDLGTEEEWGWANVLVVGRRGVRNAVDGVRGAVRAAFSGREAGVGATRGRNGVEVTGGSMLPLDVVGVQIFSSPKIAIAFRRASSRSP